MHNQKLIYLFLTLFLPISFYGQEFQKIPTEKWRLENKNIPDSAYYIDSSLFKAKKDHTDILQKIFDKYKTIVLPQKELNINSTGINIKSNSTIFFQEGSVLKMIPNDKEKYSILNISEVKNVKIYNPQLKGDRKNHKGEKGEWGMGVSIRSSENIEICNPYIKDTWGDGIYIGKAGNTKVVNQNILIENGIIDYTRRNGVSIVSGKNITVKNISIYNIYGVDPMEGIDIEPNKNSVALTDITLKNIKTYNTAWAGIAVVLNYMRNFKNKATKITIDNHQDDGSKYGFKIGYVRDISGELNIINSNWKNNEAPIYGSNTWVSKLKVNFIDTYKNDNIPLELKELEKDYKRLRSKKIRVKNYNIKYSK